jgi:hypothetical protein
MTAELSSMPRALKISLVACNLDALRRRIQATRRDVRGVPKTVGESPSALSDGFRTVFYPFNGGFHCFSPFFPFSETAAAIGPVSSIRAAYRHFHSEGS